MLLKHSSAPKLSLCSGGAFRMRRHSRSIHPLRPIADDRCQRALRRATLVCFTSATAEARHAPDPRVAQALARRVRDRARRLRAERHRERDARRDAQPRAVATRRPPIASLAWRFALCAVDRARHARDLGRAVRAALAGHDGAVARTRRATRGGGRVARCRTHRRGARAVRTDRRRHQRIDALLRAAQSS